METEQNSAVYDFILSYHTLLSAIRQHLPRNFGELCRKIPVGTGWSRLDRGEGFVYNGNNQCLRL